MYALYQARGLKIIYVFFLLILLVSCSYCNIQYC